ncbi:hypothetical protein M885DRAFT_530107 [Pelagophyceae sp. CCMP2097]|nr:hypothetical protein M885DRAFT_530107 [Pelagophyceae sp. CCMP2097]|mmetsp:Transcript_14419/g.51273  ORF Transcript_14419/g.51273 Transcript_14419/m.51273 type:complete len:239 (+) Transcript_14419:29-745(+)
MAVFGPVLCPMCEQTFASEAVLLEHCGGLLPEEGDEAFWCSCGASFCAPQAMAAHAEATGHAPEDAEDDGFEDDDDDDDDGELRRTPAGEPLCPLCDVAFASEEALVAHCGGEMPRRGDDAHWCGCGRQFCSSAALLAHTRALGHEAERPGGPETYEELQALDDDNFRRGLSDAAKAALKERPVGETEACEDPITKDVLTPGTQVVDLPCGHVFAKPTLYQWFEQNRTCPVCRLELEE